MRRNRRRSPCSLRAPPIIDTGRFRREVSIRQKTPVSRRLDHQPGMCNDAFARRGSFGGQVHVPFSPAWTGDTKDKRRPQRAANIAAVQQAESTHRPPDRHDGETRERACSHSGGTPAGSAT